MIFKKKVALIVDNPRRDLDGLVLLSTKLVERGFEAFLVPMYTQNYEVPAISPDIVILNYARKANANLIQSYKKAGIIVGILDTEGGVWDSDKQFINSIDHSLFPYIDFYCLWGTTQLEAFKKYTKYSTDKLFVTGCPRFDFYKQPLLQTMGFNFNHLKPFVLIASNFALAAPKFASSEKEIENMISCGYERKVAEQRLKDESYSRTLLKKLVKTAAPQFPNLNFVIRTHPFESDFDYKNEFVNLKNVHVISEGVIGPWLREAQKTLHFNSSIAIDAYLIGKPSYTLDWLSTDAIRAMSPVSYESSIKLKSEEQFINVLKNSGNEMNLASEGIQKWFHTPSTGAASLVADTIAKNLKNESGLDKKLCTKMALYGSSSPKSVRGWIEGLGRFTLGPNNFNFLRTWVLTKNIGRGTKVTKEFKQPQIKKIISSLNTSTNILVRAINNKDLVIPRTASSTIVVESKSMAP